MAQKPPSTPQDAPQGPESVKVDWTPTDYLKPSQGQPSAPETAPTEGVEFAMPVSRVSVLERRLANPFGTPSREVPLRGERRGWVVRVFTADAEHPNRHYQAVHELGWMPLRVSDMAISPDDLGFTVSADGRIVRGDRGRDILMAMPPEDYEAVQRKKSEINLSRLRAGRLRDEVSQATAKEHGDQAGDNTYKHFSQREVREAIPDDAVVE